MPIQSFNPATDELLQSFEEYSEEKIEQILQKSETCFISWKQVSLAEKKQKMLTLAALLKKEKQRLGEIMTQEMGKPITEAKAEIEKCAWCCEYYAENTESFLKPEYIVSDASESFVLLEPMGTVLAVMPWNYPFWQVIRFIAPAAMAGNVGLLKHASNVPQCALALEEIFLKAGFPKGVFQTLLIGSGKVKKVLEDDRVKAVTLTGSEYAGTQVAKVAGKEIKKSVLELGGNNPFLIFHDADMDLVVAQAVAGRFQNTGQSCIAAKRFLVHESIAEEFLQKFQLATEALVQGDPKDEKTQISCLVDKKARDRLHVQVQSTLKQGATLVTGGKFLGDKGAFYAPTIISNVQKGMSLYSEEVFGPVAAVMVVKDEAEMIAVSNDSKFGLGASLFTQDTDRIKRIIPQLETSAVFVNGIVKSDPRLPFGGAKKSGYGRELSALGMREFMNVKTVWVK